MFELKKYLRSLPNGYAARAAFGNWLSKEASPLVKRRIVQWVERQVKDVVGGQLGVPLLMVDARTWERLRALAVVRQTVLDELVVPTAEEVALMGEVNDRLYRLTQQLYTKTFELWKTMNDSGLPLNDDNCVEGAIDNRWDESRPAMTLDNDAWYASDFNYMLWFLGEFDQRDPHTMKSLHEILQDFGMTEEGARKELIDTYDDGDTWTEGALLKPAFKDITVCYALHALCCHFHYALADVLRMSSFAVKVQVEYRHLHLMNRTTK